MKKGLNFFFKHFFITVFFIVAAIAYFSPVLQGKVIYQHDIAQYTGMAKEQNDFRKQYDQEPYWTNSAFGGMPTFQLGANYPHNYVKQLDRLIRSLPRPADYLFLYFIGFYILLSCLRLDYRLAIIGALAFGFSTYLIIILGAGHNAKAHAIAYLPMVLGGIILVFRKKYLWGFFLTTLAMALEIVANHYQMTYYFLIVVLCMGIVYFIHAIKNKELLHFFKSVGVLVVAVTLGVGANAAGLMATKQYADWSTRGKTELTLNPDGSLKENTTGLSKEYITQWSYGISESLNLFVPRLFGGASQENLGEDSKSYNYLIDKGLPKSSALSFVSGVPLYWGDQPVTSGPAYLGAVVLFLFVLGLFLVRSKHKWWLLFGTLFSLVLSWGKNFSTLTDFMIDYVPLYDKFRAVSSIQVILELCVPILAILALHRLINHSVPEAKKLNALKFTSIAILSVVVLLFVFKGVFDFMSPSDARLRMTGLEQLPEMLRLDRKEAYTSDLLRSLGYVLLTAGVLWFLIKQKISTNLGIAAIGILIVVDLVGVNLRYVNNDSFVSKRKMLEPFQATAADKEILKDPAIFRVFDQGDGFNSAKTAYFHQSITGYHAAKPAGIQDLFDYHIYNSNLGVFNMLNVKYIIRQDEDGNSFPMQNPDANGNAWFVKQLKSVSTADEEIRALDTLDTKHTAVVRASIAKTIKQMQYQVDSTASITLESYAPNRITYVTNNANPGVAVFSEMYYPHGWQVALDTERQGASMFKVNYVLRALEIPAGKHTITFSYEPTVVDIGSQIAVGSMALFGLLFLSGFGFTLWKNKKADSKE